MHQPCRQLAERGHLGALHQLLLALPYLRVVAPHCLHFQQPALLIEQPTLGPHPPGMPVPWQLQADLRAAQRLLRGKRSQPLYERQTLAVGHPLAQVHLAQLLRCALQLFGERPVAEQQLQVRGVAADHRG
ncbi:hypothetical protein D3C73_999120 [compost metagenome]